MFLDIEQRRGGREDTLTITLTPELKAILDTLAQGANRVTGNILHCLEHGFQLVWLIDPSDRSVIVFQAQQQPKFRHQKDQLLVLQGIELAVTTEQVFSGLSMKAA